MLPLNILNLVIVLLRGEMPMILPAKAEVWVTGALWFFSEFMV